MSYQRYPVHAQPSWITIVLGFGTGGDLIDLDEVEDAAAETMLIPVDNFPEVPLEVVEASGWKDVASGQWRYKDENINYCLGEQSPHTWN